MMPKVACCLFMTPPGRVELRDFTLPARRENELLVEVLTSGISPGTELRCLAGREEGAPAEGFVPGYQAVGRIVAGESAELGPGDRIFLSGTVRASLPLMWGGHVSHALCPVHKAYPVAPGASTEVAVFAKLAAISHRGLRMAAVQAEEQTAVVGLGPIGFFSAQILQAKGLRVTAFDLSAERVEVARLAGIDARQIERSQALGAQIRAVAEPDVLIDATGVAALIPEFIAAGKELPWVDHSSRGLRLVVQGSYAGNCVVDYKTAFMKEISVHFPRDNQPQDIRAVLELMANGLIGLPAAAVARVGPHEAPAVYQRLQAGAGLPLTAAICWQTAGGE